MTQATTRRETDIAYDPDPGSPPFIRGNRTHRGPLPTTNPDPEPEETEEPWDEEEEQEQEHANTLADFIEAHKDSITRRVIEAYPPVYQPQDAQQNGPLPHILRRPIGAQIHALRAAIISLKAHQGTIIIGEMGTGKTFVGAAATYAAGFDRILVLCPPHLVKKWQREIQMTVPNAKAVIVTSITDLNKLADIERKGPLYVVMSREKAKLSYTWRAAYNLRFSISQTRDANTHGLPRRRIRVMACPNCSTQILDHEGTPISSTTLNRKRHTCTKCSAPLWTADNTGRRRFPLATYVKLRLNKFFDVLIADEVHEYKGQGTAQGIAGGKLASACRRSLILTGTFMGGYSSTLFHLLYRFSPGIKTEFRHSDLARWIDRYGFRQKVKRTRDDGQAHEHGRQSYRKAYRTQEKETPGLAPGALLHIIGNSIFIRLHDVTNKLPPYNEEVMTLPLDEEADPNAEDFSQESAYDHLASELKKAMLDALKKGSHSLMGKYLQSLLSFPDGCTKGETVLDPEDDFPIVDIPPLNPEKVYPKEQALVDLVKEEKANGRRVLVYVTHTNARDITPRLEQILARENINTATLKPSTNQKTEQREAWIENQVSKGIDVLMCNPRLVQTGLDLVDFPTVIWYETDYSIYTMRQASRRSWRIGQTKPVKVIYMLYSGTLQQDALRLIAKKMKTALAVEGELPEEGLVSFENTQDDMVMALAKRIVRGTTDEDDQDSLEAIFARAKQTETEDLDLLVNNDWAYTDLDQDDEDEEPQAIVTVARSGQVRISIAEFLAQPTNKTRKKQPDNNSPSLFDWALEQEKATAA